MSQPLIDSQTRFEAAPAAERSVARLARLLPLDALRGLIIVAMALDHANLFVAREHPSPEFWSGSFPAYLSALAFLTRLVTHVAAPGFFFLMGAGMALFADSRRRLGWSEWAIARHFVVRGALLIGLQLLVENPAWQIGEDVPFGPQLFLSYVGVLYGLGAAMIVGALFLRLRPAALIGLSLAAALTTELTISALRPAAAPPPLPVLLLLVPWRSPSITVYYPLIPWLGLALFGMAFGRWLIEDPARAYRRALGLGAAFLALFAALRLAGGIGNIRPPAGPGWMPFLNVVKYPPSAVFVLLTLGVDLLLLSLLARAGAALGRWAQPFLVFGSSPLFFYIAHLYLYGLIGLVLGSRGVGIARMYPYWLLGLAILYPLCWMYGRFKRGRAPDSVWRLF
jgi:uncharacterized membrane protein